jgi:IclR family transcriptional regulator, mhp operon transcriptional activator
MNPGRSSRYRAIRGLARGLHVLRALGERPPGGWSPTELAEYLKMHRTTLKRICETLRDLQYVSMDADTGRYSLAPSIRSLAAGFRDDDALILAAQRLMPELIEKLVWPVFLSVPERHAMVSRIENHHLSPLAFHRTTLGHCFPFHATATGRAYLAACAPEQRYELLRSHCSPEMRSRTHVGLLERRIASRVIDGFGVNDNGWGPFRNFSAIALPVYVDRRLTGSLTMGFPRSAMNSKQAIDRFGDRMRSEAERIGAAASSIAMPEQKMAGR